MIICRKGKADAKLRVSANADKTIIKKRKNNSLLLFLLNL